MHHSSALCSTVFLYAAADRRVDQVQWAVAEKTLGQLLLEDDTLLMQGGAVVGPSDPISAVFEAMDRHRVHRVPPCLLEGTTGVILPAGCAQCYAAY